MPTIDSDAHVIESEKTWSYLAEDEKAFCADGSTQIRGRPVAQQSVLAKR